VTIAWITPIARREPFGGPEWTFELKYDGFRAIADTVNGSMLLKRGNRMHRFEALLGLLPADCVLDGEVVALDAAGRPSAPCAASAGSAPGVSRPAPARIIGFPPQAFRVFSRARMRLTKSGDPRGGAFSLSSRFSSPPRGEGHIVE
jgi:hypothetical protein